MEELELVAEDRLGSAAQMPRWVDVVKVNAHPQPSAVAALTG
jgi:hypothetical protein